MINNAKTQLPERYLAALRHHVRRRSRKASLTARRIGRTALALGLETLDLARMHERALDAVDGRGGQKGRVEAQASAFFVEASMPIEQTHPAARESRLQVRRLREALRARSAALASVRRRLKHEVVRRRRVEENLAKGAKENDGLLSQSRRMQEQMRDLARRIILAQEEERKEISRELHDEIAQTLAGINVQLASLKEAAAVNTRGLNRKIAATQRLVERSVNSIHQFARDLRPALLDDLGLIPALRSFMKALPGRDGLRIHLTAFAGVEAMESAKRTVLYRVAQEALTNVARHARARIVVVHIRKIRRAVCMEVKDNGRSFRPDRILASKTNRRLGLIGMRERVEMVGGTFSIESAPGVGTTVRAVIPFNHRTHA
jgi:signal transduction histidine kinase